MTNHCCWACDAFLSLISDAKNREKAGLTTSKLQLKRPNRLNRKTLFWRHRLVCGCDSVVIRGIIFSWLSVNCEVKCCDSSFKVILYHKHYTSISWFINNLRSILFVLLSLTCVSMRVFISLVMRKIFETLSICKKYCDVIATRFCNTSVYSKTNRIL